MIGRHLIQLMAKQEIGGVATFTKRPLFFPPGVVWKAWNLLELKKTEELNDFFGDVQALVQLGAIVPNAEREFSIKSLLGVNVSACAGLAEWALKKIIPMIF